MFVPYLDYIQTEYDVIFLHCKNDMEYSRLQIQAIKECEISSTFHTYKLLRTFINLKFIILLSVIGVPGGKRHDHMLQVEAAVLEAGPDISL